MTKTFAAIAAALLGALLALGVAAPAQATPDVAGHRGATGVSGYPEETLKATGYADRYGASIVEGDVQYTSDGVPVMLHDTTLDRTTRCSGKPSALTFAQLRRCATAAEVPELRYWLREAKRLGLVVNVEIRNGITAKHVATLASIIRSEAPAEVVVASWYPAPLDLAKKALGSRVKVAPIIGPTGSPFGYSVAEHAKKYDVILPDFRWLIVARVRWYHEAGVEVWAWTGKTTADITRMKALKVDVLIVDDVRKVTGR